MALAHAESMSFSRRLPLLLPLVEEGLASRLGRGTGRPHVGVDLVGERRERVRRCRRRPPPSAWRRSSTHRRLRLRPGRASSASPPGASGGRRSPCRTDRERRRWPGSPGPSARPSAAGASRVLRGPSRGTRPAWPWLLLLLYRRGAPPRYAVRATGGTVHAHQGGRVGRHRCAYRSEVRRRRRSRAGASQQDARVRARGVPRPHLAHRDRR